VDDNSITIEVYDEKWTGLNNQNCGTPSIKIIRLPPSLYSIYSSASSNIMTIDSTNGNTSNDGVYTTVFNV